MFKKSLGIALLSITVLTMGACSSDDDDEGTTGETTAAVDAGTADADAGTADADAGTADADAGTADADAGTADADAGTADADAGTADADAGTADADAGTADAGNTDTGSTDAGTGGNDYSANSVMGVVAANADLSILAGALKPSFDQNLDTANQNWTLFAPTNSALEAAIAGGAVVTDVVLQSHIFTGGAVGSGDLVVGESVSMSNNSTYVITSTAEGGLQIGGVDIITPDVAVDNGALHIIDGVLLPN